MSLIGRYRIRRKLGEGGMGSVLLADDEHGRLVVLKIPHQVSDEITARMRDEAQIGFQLRHAHIVRTLDFFMDGTRPVIVIEYINGTSLRDLRDSVGALPPAMVARVGEQISDALSALHHLRDHEGRSLEILHRDVTPGNILVDRQGHARLIDLGIARSVMSQATKTAVGILRGTFRYLSPDLFAGQPYSWMTDLWALGVTLFEASVGRKASEGNEHKVFDAIIHGRITHFREDEAIHPALRYLFDGLLVVNPDDRRFRDPEDVLHAFRVIRGRLGDGEGESIEILGRVPLMVDDDDEATEVAEQPAPPMTDLSDLKIPVGFASAEATTGPVPARSLSADPLPDDPAEAPSGADDGIDVGGVFAGADEAFDVDVDDDFEEDTLVGTPDEGIATAVNIPMPIALETLPTLTGGLSVRDDGVPSATAPTPTRLESGKGQRGQRGQRKP